MFLTRTLAELEDRLPGSTGGWLSNTLDRATAPAPVPTDGSIPLRLPTYEYAPTGASLPLVPPLAPADAAPLASPCTRCVHHTPGTVVGFPGAPINGAYLAPPGTGRQPTQNNFAPTGANLPTGSAGGAPGLIAGYPVAWWILGGLLLLVLLDDRKRT